MKTFLAAVGLVFSLNAISTPLARADEPAVWGVFVGSTPSDGPISTVIQYSCPGGGFGRSTLTMITPRSLRIETQGISDNLPFNYVLQARRVGDCPARASASAH